MGKINIAQDIPFMMEEQSAFLDVFGNSPVMKLLDFFVAYEDFDYKKRDIARLSGVDYSAMKTILSKLKEQKIVVSTKKVGKEKMYRLNFKNPAAKKFREFYWQVTHDVVNKMLEEEPEIAT